MPGYNKKGLKRFGHEAPARRQDSPHEHAPLNYGAKVQYATDNDTSAPLDDVNKKRIQQIIGTFLFASLTRYAGYVRIGQCWDSTQLSVESSFESRIHAHGSSTATQKRRSERGVVTDPEAA